MGPKNQVRIIAGKWRGRQLRFSGKSPVRPSKDSDRETLFNWLSPYISGSRCLDLFAGSGALGFEALSRGAIECILIEQNPKLYQSLCEHQNILGADNATLLQRDTIGYLKHPPPQPFDIVFCDPPFDKPLLEPCIAALSKPGWLAAESYIYIESRAPYEHIPDHWQLWREKNGKKISIAVYKITNLF